MDLSNVTLVYFHIETTGLSNYAHILQISASYNQQKFSIFLKARKFISPDVSDLNGFTMSGEKDRLYWRKQEVDYVSITKACKSFLKFLEGVEGPVILAANNCYRFQARILFQLIRTLHLIGKFRAIVVGFVDTWPIFRKALPDRAKHKGSFGIKALAKDYLKYDKFEPGPNDPSLYVETIRRLVKYFEIRNKDIKREYISFSKCIYNRN